MSGRRSSSVLLARRAQPGNCYATCEALWHLLGGRRSGWTPEYVRTLDGTHWYLRHNEHGTILDPTRAQFLRFEPNYDTGTPCGFLTREPSQRARKLMEQLVWKNPLAMRNVNIFAQGGF